MKMWKNEEDEEDEDEEDESGYEDGDQGRRKTKGGKWRQLFDEWGR